MHLETTKVTGSVEHRVIGGEGSNEARKRHASGEARQDGSVESWSLGG